MKYLALMFHGTLQSWGGDSSIKPNPQSPRTTETMPTLGAIYGLIRSAMGDSRASLRKELYDAHILIRGDRLGSVTRDYQVATRTHHGFIAGSTVVTPKMNIQDATFVVLVGHKNPLITETWAQALNSPVWSPFIGRRAHVPSLPILMGTLSLEDPMRFLVEELPVMWGTELGSAKQVPILTNTPFTNTPVNTRIIKDIPIESHPRMKKYKESVMYRTHFPTKRTHKSLSTVKQYAALVEMVHTRPTKNC